MADTSMPRGPWTIKGVEQDARELALRCAQQAGEPVWKWLGDAIREKAARGPGEVMPPGHTSQPPKADLRAVVLWSPNQMEALARLMEATAALSKVRVREPGLKARMLKAAGALVGQPGGDDPSAQPGPPS